jgi:predicted RNase H-like HicB family nuclease
MKVQFTYWQKTDGRYLGFLNKYPEHWTQGDNLEDLKDQLRDLHVLFEPDDIPGIRRVEELEIA